MKKLSKFAVGAGVVTLLGMASSAQAGLCNIGGITSQSFPGDSFPHTIMWGNGLEDKRSSIRVNICGEPDMRTRCDIAPDGNWFCDMRLDDILTHVPVPLPGDPEPIYCKFRIDQYVYSSLKPYTNSCELGPILVPLLHWENNTP